MTPVWFVYCACASDTLLSLSHVEMLLTSHHTSSRAYEANERWVLNTAINHRTPFVITSQTTRYSRHFSRHYSLQTIQQFGNLGIQTQGHSRLAIPEVLVTNVGQEGHSSHSFASFRFVISPRYKLPPFGTFQAVPSNFLV